MSTVPISDIKEQAHKVVDSLPNNATWDDLMERIYVEQVIEKGNADAEAGRVKDVEEVRRSFGLSK